MKPLHRGPRGHDDFSRTGALSWTAACDQMTPGIAIASLGNNIGNVKISNGLSPCLYNFLPMVIYMRQLD